MKAYLGILLLVGSASALSLGGCACGSGGCPGQTTSTSSSSSGTSTTSSGFTSFAAMPKPGTSTLPGITTEGSYTAGAAPAFDVTGHSPASQGSGTVTLTVDGSGNATALTINGALSSVTFSLANGATSGPLGTNYLYAISADGKQLAIGANYLAPAQNFNYQTYGIWATGLTTGSGNIGAISAGAVTPGGSIPTTGTATYNGTAGGVYVDPNGAQWLAAGTATLVATFATHSVSYSTSTTTSASVVTGAALPNAAATLNMTGTLSFSAGTNNLSGTATTSSAMSGPVQGRFYGPNATEAGGTFALTNGAVQGYLGAFGATTP